MKLAIITRVKNLEEAVEGAESAIDTHDALLDEIQEKLSLINWDVVRDPQSADLSHLQPEARDDARDDADRVANLNESETSKDDASSALDTAHHIRDFLQEILNDCKGDWETLEEANRKRREFRMRLEVYVRDIFRVLFWKIKDGEK